MPDLPLEDDDAAIVFKADGRIYLVQPDNARNAESVPAGAVEAFRMYLMLSGRTLELAAFDAKFTKSH